MSTVVCVFAKPPLPGRVKTRLAAAIGEQRAADLARAFVRDTWATLQAIPWARAVLATTDPGTAQALGLDAEEWLQGGGDLGERVERVLARAIDENGPPAIGIGADTPGLPQRLLERARRALAHADAVLGPARDGGFYMIGLRRCPPGLLGGLPWSRANTFARSLARLRQRGLKTRVLPRWFDVDTLSDLDLLRTLIDRGKIDAPETARALNATLGVLAVR